MGAKFMIKPTRNNFIVKNPVKPITSTLVITDAIKKEYMEEQLANAQKAEIIAVGASCIEIKVGDIVRIKPSRFMSAEPLENGEYLLFSEGDVSAIFL